jgi:hypothetical protein
MSKLKLWNDGAPWEEAEDCWNQAAAAAAQEKSLKKLTVLPNMPGMTPDTAKNLKWKSLRWMIAKDHGFKILKGFLKHPVKYGWRYFKSIFKNKSYIRDGDFFLYGINSVAEFENSLQDPNTLLVVGFSYCHKPFECPSGRFTDQCIRDTENAVCKQCFIGKAVHALPNVRTYPLFIPTIHYIGDQIFQIVHGNPKNKVIFIITACEMTLEMFGDWGNMVGIEGIGVRLDGRICNTMEAFRLSEEGVKPGLTVVLNETQQRILNLIRTRRKDQDT